MTARPLPACPTHRGEPLQPRHVAPPGGLTAIWAECPVCGWRDVTRRLPADTRRDTSLAGLQRALEELGPC